MFVLKYLKSFCKKHFSFCRIVGDNIDYYIQAGIQSKENKNQSIHWTQQYAILDTHPQKALSCFQTTMFRKDLRETLVSRVITKHLKCFQHVNDAVIWHIEHPHSEEVSKKSNIVSLIYCNEEHFIIVE
jgi:hypothetical protein